MDIKWRMWCDPHEQKTLARPVLRSFSKEGGVRQEDIELKEMNVPQKDKRMDIKGSMRSDPQNKPLTFCFALFQ